MDLEEHQPVIDLPVDPYPATEGLDNEQQRELPLISIEGDDGHAAFITKTDILPLVNAIITQYTYYGRHLSFESIYRQYLEMKEQSGGVPEVLKGFHCIDEHTLSAPAERFPVHSGRYNAKQFLGEILQYFHEIREVLPEPTLASTEILFNEAHRCATNDQKYKIADIERLLGTAFLVMKQSTTVRFNHHHRFVEASIVFFPLHTLLERLNIPALNTLTKCVQHYGFFNSLRRRQTSISSVVQGLRNIILKIRPVQRIPKTPQPQEWPSQYHVIHPGMISTPMFPAHLAEMPYDPVYVDMNHNHEMANGPQHPELANGHMIPLMQPAFPNPELVNGNMMVPQMHPDQNMLPDLQPVLQNHAMQWHNGHVVPQMQHPSFANTSQQLKYETVPGYEMPVSVRHALIRAGEEAMNPEDRDQQPQIVEIDGEMNSEREMDVAMGFY